MSDDKFFLDTNILVYSLDPADPEKAAIAEQLVKYGVASRLCTISYQVVQEFLNVSLRLFKTTMTLPEIERYYFRVLLPLMKVPSSPRLFLEALALQSTNQIAWYDALIVTAALQDGCKILYSEDLQHSRRFGDLVVENPFL